MLAADRGDGLRLTMWRWVGDSDAPRWVIYSRPGRARELGRDLPSPSGAVGLQCLLREIFDLHVDMQRFQADHEREVEQRRKAGEILAG